MRRKLRVKCVETSPYVFCVLNPRFARYSCRQNHLLLLRCPITPIFGDNHMMTTQIRDTQFGHVVRLLSRRRVLRYNDEIDTSLYKSSIHSKHERGADVSGEDRDGQVRGSGTDSKERDRQNRNPDDIRTYPIRGVEEGIFLVDWYGSDDPEVCTAIPACKDVAHMQLRTPRTGPAIGSSW
jgi:hypothetical protein